MKKLIFTLFTVFFAHVVYATTYYVGPGGNDNNNGLSPSTAFSTIQYAIGYVAAHGGPVGNEVVLLGGTWGEVIIQSVAATESWTSNLVIRGENPDVLLSSSIWNACQHLTFKGFKFKGTLGFNKSGRYCVYEDIVGVGKTYWRIRASDLTLRRCIATDDFVEKGDVMQIAADGNLPENVPTNILIEDCCFRGSSTPDGNHIDVIQTLGVKNLTFRRCKITHAPTGLFMPTKVGSVPIENLLFEECYFEDGRLYGASEAKDWIYRNCTMKCNFNYARPQGIDEWTGNTISAYATVTTVEIPDVFENNIVGSTSQTLPPSNIIDPNLVITTPACGALNPIDVTGVNIVENAVTLSVNQSVQLTSEIFPSNASNRTVSWSSSNPSVALVDSNTGFVSALSGGTATITVTTDQFGFTDQCVITSILDTQAPTIPASLTVGAVTTGSVALSWNSSNDNIAVAGYKVYTNGTNPVVVTGTNTTIDNLADNTNYNFSVTAFDAAGNESAQSSPVNVATLELFGVTSGTTWQSFTESSQTGTFSATFDAIPNASDIDAITGISDGAASAYGDLACIIRFNSSGQIDARNGGAYEATNTINYTSGLSYHFRVEIDVPNHTYSVYVAESGGAEQTVASGFAFRTEQATVAQLNTWSIYAYSGSHNVDNVLFIDGGIDLEAPIAPTGLTASTIAETSVTLSWSASTDNIGVAGYKVYTNGANPISVDGTSTTLSGLSASTQYNFSVSAYDAAGNESTPSDPILVTTLGEIVSGAFYCDPVNGSISNNGSESSPWGTLEAVFAAGKTFDAGDIIYLLNGNHGAVTIQGTNSDYVTITAKPGETPEVDYIKFVSASKWIVSELEFSPAFDPTSDNNYFVRMDVNSTYNTIDNCTMLSVFDVNSATEWNSKAWSGFNIDGPNNTITNNDLQNIRWGFRVDYTATNTTGNYNTITNLSYDGIQSLASYCTYEYNIIKNVYEIDSNHDDFFQCYSYDGSSVGTTTVYGVVLRGNTFISFTDPNQFDKSDCQGIGNFDGMYEDWVVENNLISTDQWHGITFLGATNCKIVNNTVIKNPINAYAYTPWIQVSAQKASQGGQASIGNIVANNLCADLNNDADIGTVENNIVISWSDYGLYFSDFNNFDYATIEGSPAIDAGSSNNAPNIDIEGTSRPQGSGYDVGAYEYADAIIPVDDNLALNKPITVSSYQDDSFGTNPGENLVDGNVSDDARWSASGFPQYAVIDLEDTYELNQVKLFPYQDRAYQYIIEGSNDGSSFTTIVDRSTNTESADILVDNISGIYRYIRLTVNGLSGSTSTWVSLAELEIYGNAVTIVNNAPTIDNVSNLNVLDNAGQQTVILSGISDGDGNTQIVSVSAFSSNAEYVNILSVDYAPGNSTATLTFDPVSAGIATLTVTVTDNGGTDNGGIDTTNISFDVLVEQSCPEIYNVSVNCPTSIFTVTQTYQFVPIVLPECAENKTVSWASSDSSVVSVDANGLLTAISVGTAIITVTTNEGSATANCTVTVVNQTDLPSPWENSDIGAVGAAGSATYLNGTFTVDGSGANIWNSNDEFHFVYQQISGDATIVARITSISNTHQWTKGGVMMRETLDANSINGNVFLAPIASNGSKFSYRSSTGATSAEFDGPNITAPYWLRLERQGDTFTGSFSVDGTSWVTLGSKTISMSATYYVGLSVTAISDGSIATATFDNVVVDTQGTDPLIEDWIEDFSDLTDGATLDNGETAWTTSTTGVNAGAIFEVQNNVFTASYLGAEAVWASEVIDIDGETDIAIDWGATGNMEATDYAKIYYILDGGTETLLAEHYDVFGRTIEQTTVNGSSIQIIIKLLNSATDEFYELFNISVTGQEVAASKSNKSNKDITTGMFKPNISFSMYPNPLSQGELTIDITGLDKGVSSKLQVIGITGKLFYSEVISGENSVLKKTLNIDELGVGMYFIRIHQGGDSLIRKLIIQ